MLFRIGDLFDIDGNLPGIDAEIASQCAIVGEQPRFNFSHGYTEQQVRIRTMGQPLFHKTGGAIGPVKVGEHQEGMTLRCLVEALDPSSQIAVSTTFQDRGDHEVGARALD